MIADKKREKKENRRTKETKKGSQNMIKACIFDLDGTLLNHEGQVTPRTRAALQAASDRGVVIVPTTGRPLGNLPSTFTPETVSIWQWSAL